MTFFQSQAHYGRPEYSQAPDFQPFKYGPQPQLPEPQPGIAGLLAGSLGSGLGEGVAGGIKQQLKSAALEKLLSGVQPNMSAKEQLGIIGRAPEELQKPFGEYFSQENKLRNQREQDQAYQQTLPGISETINENNQPETLPVEDASQELAAEKQAILKNYSKLSNEGKKAANKRIDKIQKEEKEIKKVAKEKDHLQNLFNELADTYNSGDIGYQASFSPWPFRGKYNKAKGKMNSTMIRFRNGIGKLENRGHLTKSDLEAVDRAVPLPDDTLDEMQGKLTGMASVLGLDTSRLTSSNPNQPQTQPQSNQPNSDTDVTMRAPDGRVAKIKKENVDKALKLGAVIVNE